MTACAPSRPEAYEVYVTRMGEHLARVGDDPWRRLLAIELLARAARVEWLVKRRTIERQRRSAP